tara:strand:+ start:15071 stop:15406 length:336 start_codon:yes stop_codon:yes gene_type:complete
MKDDNKKNEKEQCIIPVVTRSFEGWTRFNMNHYCLVQPNERGKEQFIKSWMLTMSRTEAEDYYNSLLDEDGYMKLQLWSAFEYFGDSMNIGMGALHANEFYLQTERLENCG